MRRAAAEEAGELHLCSHDGLSSVYGTVLSMHHDRRGFQLSEADPFHLAADLVLIPAASSKVRHNAGAPGPKKAVRVLFLGDRIAEGACTGKSQEQLAGAVTQCDVTSIVYSVVM